jgi:hypothetical protein
MSEQDQRDQDQKVNEVLFKTFPGVAANARRVNARPQELNQLAGYATVWNEHKRLSSLPEGVAQSEWDRLNTETKDVLTSLYPNSNYNPNFTPQKKGAFTRVLEGLVGYGTGLTALYRYKKLNEQGTFQEMFPEYDEVQAKIAGATTDVELINLRLKDQQVNDFLKNQWKFVQSESVYDKKAEDLVREKYDPATFELAKKLASNTDIYTLLGTAESPEEVKALVEFTLALDDPEDPDGENLKDTPLMQAKQELERAKLSIGREYARDKGLEKYDRIGSKRDRFDLVSGSVDALALVFFDPLTYAIGPAAKAHLVAKYGLMKTAALDGVELSAKLEKMFSYRKVRRFWDDVGSLIGNYNKAPNLNARALIADDIAKKFEVKTSTIFFKGTPDNPITVDLITEWAKAGIKDAPTAMQYFQNVGVLQLIGKGTAGGRVPLMPTRTVMQKFGSEYIVPGLASVLGFSKQTVSKVWDDGEQYSLAFYKAAEENQMANFLGTKRGIDSIKYAFERQLRQNTIEIGNASDTEAFKKLLRMAGADNFAAKIGSQAWREAPQGLRLRMLIGTYLTIGRRLGLESTKNGKEFLERTIKQFSDHLYAPDITVVNAIGDDILRLAGTGLRPNLDPKAFARKTSGAFGDLATQRRQLAQTIKSLNKELKDAKQALLPDEDEIARLEKEINRTGALLKEVSSKAKKLSTGLGYDKQNILKDALRETGIRQRAVDDYMAILREGGETATPEAYEKALDVVRQALYGSPKYQKLVNDPAFDFNTYVLTAFPSKDEVIKNLDVIRYNPAQLGDRQVGVLEYQVNQTQIKIPDLSDAAKQLRKPWRRLFGINNKTADRAVDAWSAGNLVGTLGFRSVIEENLFFILASPINVVKTWALGKAINTELRYVKYGADKPIGAGGSLGFANWLVYRFIKGDPIKAAERAALAQNPEALAQVVAQRVVAKKALIALTGISSKKVEKWVKSFVNSEYGLGVMDEINEGAFGTLNISEGSTRNTVNRMQKLYGNKLDEWNGIPDEAYVNFIKDQATGGNKAKFDTIRQGENLDFKLKWLTNIYDVLNRSRNNKYGEIVLKGASQKRKPKEIIDELTEYIEKRAALGELEGVELYKAKGAKVYAERLYDTIMVPFLKFNGLPNDELIKKVVRTEIDPQTGSKLTRFKSMLDLDDIAEFDYKSMPDTIFGRNFIPTAEPTPEGFLEKAIRYGMSWMGQQISILGREPIFQANVFQYRKMLDTVETAIVKQHIKNGLSQDLAENLADRWASNVASFLSFNRTISYVDNPAIRSNLAFASRNLARYHRALEDYYRRIYRLGKYNPDFIIKLRLLAEGVDHAGFIYADPDSGERYFMYPGDEITYKVLSYALSGFRDMDVFRQPVPGEITGRISMLTPGIDPEAALPALSSPFSAVAVRAFEALIGDRYFPEFSDELRRVTLGKYAVGRSGWELYLPAKVNRIFRTLSDDERSSVRASYTRKAILLLGATGQFPNPETGTDGEWEDFYEKVNVVGRNLAYEAWALGTFVPAAPQFGVGADIPDWVKKDLGVTSYKREFNKLLQFYGKDPDAMSKARNKWITMFPNKSIYMLSESESDGLARLASAKETVDFLVRERDLVKKYPRSAPFLAPNDGNFDLQAYNYLIDTGYLESKTVKDFFKESIAADQYFFYRQVRVDHERKLEQMTDPVERRIQNLKWETWSKEFRGRYPRLREYMENITSNNEAKMNIISDLELMIRNGDMPNTQNGRDLAKMIAIYNDFTIGIDKLQGSRDVEVQARKILRQRALDELFKIAEENPNVMNAYRTLFDPLVGE